MSVLLDPEDQARVAAAVAKAEAATSGEILCVLTEEVSEYREAPLAVAAVLALVLPPLAFALGVQPLSLTDALGGWSVANSPAAEARVGLAITLYAAAQAVLFVGVFLAASIPSVRRLITPGSLKDRRVDQAAAQHFVTMRQHLPDGVPGVLVFASVSERRLEIVADELSHAAVGQSAWDAIVKDATAELKRAGVAEGLLLAVRRCGEELAARFPDDGRPGAWPDRPLQV